MNCLTVLALVSTALLAVVSADGGYGGYGGGYSQDYSKYDPKWPVGDIYGFGAGYGGGGGGNGGGGSYGGGYSNSYYGAPPVTYIPGYGKYVPYSMPLYGNYGPPAHVPHYEQSYGYQQQHY
ncbi:hypothetical protein BV898_11697 [Hypsibius exemplaris]|uniref:Uncharacterized protein n=1 Tax=Hypsibius exemplaris TaxID=2072580 RepID=A0A1W0WG13_HYPEX|nr:hypothetical protein BV898_11697 [Hypsibius exemplaris]